MSTPKRRVNPIVEAFKQRLDTLSDFKTTLAAFAKATEIGSYAWSIGIGEIKKGTLGGVVSVTSDTGPNSGASLPPNWRAPEAGSSPFYFLQVPVGLDIPVLISPLDQEELQGRVGNCLSMEFAAQEKSYSTIGITITLAGKPFAIGCRHYVRAGEMAEGSKKNKYFGEKNDRENLQVVHACRNDCTRCSFAKCGHHDPATLGGEAMRFNTGDVPRVSCEPGKIISEVGCDVLFSENYDAKSSPDVCIFELKSKKVIEPLQFKVCKTGWINLIYYVGKNGQSDPNIVRALEVFSKIDKIGEPMLVQELQNYLQATPLGVEVYACTKGSRAGFAVGHIDKSASVVEKNTISVVPLFPSNSGATKVCQPGDCGAPWFVVEVGTPTAGQNVVLRLIGHHRGSASKVPYQARVVPLAATMKEISMHIAPEKKIKIRDVIVMSDDTAPPILLPDDMLADDPGEKYKPGPNDLDDEETYFEYNEYMSDE